MHLVCHRQNWVAQSKRGDFSTCVVPCLDQPKTITSPENVDNMLEHRRISAKSIAEQLGISRERIGSIIHEDLDMRDLSASKNSERKIPLDISRIKFFG